MSKVTTKVSDIAPVLAAANINYYEFSAAISYDTGLAQLYYDELENELDMQKFSFSNGSTCYMVVYGEGVSRHDPHFKVSHLRKISKTDLVTLAWNLSLEHIDSENYSKPEIIDALMDIDHEDYYTSYYLTTNYRDLDYDFSIIGYSQGDKVIVKLLGESPYRDLQGHLTHIFFDTPLDGSIDIFINGEQIEEIYVSEVIHDTYWYWDKKEFISKLEKYIADKEYKDVLIEWCDNNLRNELEYY